MKGKEKNMESCRGQRGKREGEKDPTMANHNLAKTPGRRVDVHIDWVGHRMKVMPS